jgi:predicted cytidylate kinase
MLARRLHLTHISAGDFMRELASQRGITLLELSRLAESDESIDREIDERSAHHASEGDGFVLDARIGWHFVPHSFKVFLDVRPEVAASRVFGARRGTEPENVDLEATQESIRRRTDSERQRYLDYYGLDYLDPAHYDLVIDTSELTPDQVVDMIVSGLIW